MKNFDTARLLGAAAGLEQDGIHLHALRYFLDPVNHHPVAGVQPGPDDD